jgi:hypothetical protein
MADTEVKCPCILVLFAPIVLELSSILHVAVLVFLRLWAIRNPLSYNELHIKMQYISIKMIGAISLLVNISATVAFMASLKNAYPIVREMNLHIFSTLPAIAILIMYVMLMYILKIKQRKKSETLKDMTASNVDTKTTRMNSIVHRLVLFLLISYIPYLIWKEMFDGLVVRKGGKTDYPDIKVNLAKI